MSILHKIAKSNTLRFKRTTFLEFLKRNVATYEISHPIRSFSPLLGTRISQFIESWNEMLDDMGMPQGQDDPIGDNGFVAFEIEGVSVQMITSYRSVFYETKGARMSSVKNGIVTNTFTLILSYEEIDFAGDTVIVQRVISGDIESLHSSYMKWAKTKFISEKFGL